MKNQNNNELKTQITISRQRSLSGSSLNRLGSRRSSQSIIIAALDDHYHYDHKHKYETIDVKEIENHPIDQTPIVDDMDPTDLNPHYNLTFSWIFTILHSLGGIYFGYSISCMNNLGVPILQDIMKITNKVDYVNALADTMLYYGIGKMIGSILAGSLQNRFGKLKLLVFSEIFNLVSAILLVIPVLWVFLIGRAVQGFYAAFLSSMAPRLVFECFPIHSRGSRSGFYALMLFLSIFIGQSLGSIFGEEFLSDNWRIFMIFPGVISLIRIFLVLLFFRHDSPEYYALNPKTTFEESKPAIIEIIQKFYKYKEHMQTKLINLEKVKNSQVDKYESTFIELLQKNFSKQKRWAFLALMGINLFMASSGNILVEIYSTTVFDQIYGKGSGYQISSFVGLA